MFADIIQVTFVLIMAYLIIANASDFATAVSAGSAAYIGAVKALQGRP